MPDQEPLSLQLANQGLQRQVVELQRKVQSLANANAYAAELVAALEEANEREQQLVRRGEELDLQTRLDLIMQEETNERLLLVRAAAELEQTQSLCLTKAQPMLETEELPQGLRAEMVGLPLVPPMEPIQTGRLDVPVYRSDKVFGFIRLSLNNVDQRWNDRWPRLLWSVGSQLGLAIERLRVEHENEKMNAELIVARDEALEASRTKTAFLANMSHELRTPMNAIIGYSEMLIDDAEILQPEDFVADLRKIQSAGKHLLSLINDVLDLSKIEAGKMTVFLEQFAIRPTIDEVIDTIRPLVLKNRNHFEIQCPDNIGYMVGDLVKFRQSLFNLLSNATKFTENGKISLKISTSVHNDIEFLNFAITDTGIGMSHDQIARLFQAFVQADSSATRKYGGTGLGLTISRKFCNMLGGEIRVASEAGKGSTFTIDLPRFAQQVNRHNEIDLQEKTSRKNAATEISPNSGRGTILAIDDSLEALEIIERYLSREGYRVLTANSAEAGLTLARTHHPDVITLDVMMPRMNGWQVLSTLKADPVCASIPVVLLSVVEDKEIGMALGATDCLSKPIDWPRLDKLLERLATHAEAESILIVEDDPASSEIARRLLERGGWAIHTAGNGREAMDLLNKSLNPALILLDLMMPVMDGFSFTESLRENPKFNHIPVIILTSKTLTAEEHRRLNGKIDDILTKGEIRRNDLLGTVNQILKQKGRPQGQAL